MTPTLHNGAIFPKVCHIIHYDGPGGGPVNIIDNLRMFHREFDLSVIHGGSGRIAEVCTELRIPHFELPLDRLWKLPAGFPLLVARLASLRPNLVFLHGQWAGPVGALATRLIGISRIIYVSHWPSFYTDWDFFRIVRNRCSEAIPCHLASRLVTISRGNRYQFTLRRLAPEEKIRLINNSIDPQRVPAPEAIRALRLRHGWDEAHCHVVSAGRLADQKQLDWLLRSWQVVQSRIAHARLWIVGDGPDRLALEQLCRELKISDSCFFLGAQPYGIEYIAAADLAAMTTLYEGHANFPLEAMICGKAIVANDVDGVNDSIRDGWEGFLVPPADIDLFAERLIQLIADPELRRTMGGHGRERARAFSPEKTMGQYRAVIQEVLAS